MRTNKKRDIAGMFDKVANDSDINSKNDYEDKQEININLNKSKKAKLNDVLGVKSTKSDTHEFRGYYLEIPLIEAIDKITEGEPKGTKSDLVNHILKESFKDNGWL